MVQLPPAGAAATGGTYSCHRRDLQLVQLLIEGPTAGGSAGEVSSPRMTSTAPFLLSSCEFCLLFLSPSPASLTPEVTKDVAS